MSLLSTIFLFILLTSTTLLFTSARPDRTANPETKNDDYFVDAPPGFEGGWYGGGGYTGGEHGASPPGYMGGGYGSGGGYGGGGSGGGSGGYGWGYGGSGAPPAGGRSEGGRVVRPSVVCRESGACYMKKLKCPARCFRSYHRSGKGYSYGGGGGGCTLDCTNCVAYC